ncbi:MAG: hypothetical protein Q9198_005996, partial [Flavoplaca austrocitrina]
MASASTTALGINELVSAILSFLPQLDLKTARLVSKRWGSLGGQMLIGTLYISPREIDMVAFDNITKHQDLSKSVKHLVYDSAQFFNLGSVPSYFRELCIAQKYGAYLHLGSANTAIKEFQKYMGRKEISDADSGLVP